MQRFLRLHRPWLIKSIESESKEFEQSYDTCLSFSTTIIRNHRHVVEHYSHTGKLLCTFRPRFLSGPAFLGEVKMVY